MATSYWRSTTASKEGVERTVGLSFNQNKSNTSIAKGTAATTTDQTPQKRSARAYHTYTKETKARNEVSTHGTWNESTVSSGRGHINVMREAKDRSDE